MTKPNPNRPAAFDVWFQAADTVYKGVPYGVTTSWAEQGRIAAADKLRTAGTEGPWVPAGDHPFVADFLYRRGLPPAAADTYEQLQAVEMDVAPRKKAADDDDDPDMIPLIDISLVLLVFFMMTTAVAALSPIDVPDMKNASTISKDVDAITINIDKRADGEVYFALRVGERSPAPEDNNLRTQELAMARLMVRLGESQRPPEVRVACHKDLERGWVRDLARELDKLKTKEQIAFYGAEVNERKK